MWYIFWTVTRQQSLKAIVFGKLKDVIKNKTIRDGGITLLFLKVQIQPRLAVLSVLSKIAIFFGKNRVVVNAGTLVIGSHR